MMSSNEHFLSLLRRVCKIFITTIISIYWKIDNMKSVTQVIKLKSIVLKTIISYKLYV